MGDGAIHTVRFEPVGVEMEVEEGETILDAAFRQGISLAHGCKEGQCSSCKSRLVEGDVELLKYSTFALPEYERDTDHILLCRAHAYSDVTVELLNYDEDLLSRSIAVKDFAGKIKSIEKLTHDIRVLEIELENPIKFWAGQYVDLKIVRNDITRAYSMATAPTGEAAIKFIVKKYPDGAFSGLLDGELKPGDEVSAKGPYGTCFRRENHPGPMIMVGGGSGMSPLWSILHCHINGGEHRPIRFFYGARTQADLFYLDEFSEIAKNLNDFEFIPVLSHAPEGDDWKGERGMVHEAVARRLKAEPLEGAIAYSCGPPPMIDAVLPVLHVAGVEPEHIHYDKFTQPMK